MAKTRRPRRVQVTVLAFLLLGLWNIWRTFTLAQYSDVMQQGATIDPRVRLGAALFWAFVFLGLALALWQGKRLARTALPLAFLVYALYHLLLLAFFVRAPAARQGWPSLLLAYGLFLAWTIWSVRRPGQTFTGEQL